EIDALAGAAPIQIIHLIRVVRDQDHLRLVVLLAVGTQVAQAERLGVGAQDVGEHGRSGAQLRIPVLGRLDDPGVDAERGVVDEQRVVHHRQVDAVLTNTRPCTVARSMVRSAASPNASRAPTTSSRSSPRSSAKWFLVPAGMTTSGMPWRRAPPAPSAWEPPPPAIPITSVPRATASSASCTRSSPLFRTMASIPRRAHSSATWNLVALPPPETGFMISVACAAAGTGEPSDAGSGASARSSAERAVPVATTPRTTAERILHQERSATTSAAT